MNVKKSKKIVVLATGGTIAGWADDVDRAQNYRAGQIGVAQLLDKLEASAHTLVSEQLAQIDSKDVDDELWRCLAERAAHWLAQSDVQGVVVTHGTDTLEETAYFLQTLLRPTKPLVLTCAMRAANAPDSDGPRNLQDAIALAASPSAIGVLVVCAGEVHAGQEVQKLHSQRLNPFTSGELGPIGRMQAGRFERLRDVCVTAGQGPMPTLSDVLACAPWPRVVLVLSHAGVTGEMVEAVLASQPPDGWVVAGTGNGTVHKALQAALEKAHTQGAMVVRASRCALGGVQDRTDDVFAHAGTLTAVQARVALMLVLIAKKKAA